MRHRGLNTRPQLPRPVPMGKLAHSLRYHRGDLLLIESSQRKIVQLRVRDRLRHSLKLARSGGTQLQICSRPARFLQKSEDLGVLNGGILY